jgi:hypothetical protein
LGPVDDRLQVSAFFAQVSGTLIIVPDLEQFLVDFLVSFFDTSDFIK